jgi:hypothetical protein
LLWATPSQTPSLTWNLQLANQQLTGQMQLRHPHQQLLLQLLEEGREEEVDLGK